jgi:hypothetical protein
MYVCTGDIIFDLMLDTELGPRVIVHMAWENPWTREPDDEVFYYWPMR